MVRDVVTYGGHTILTVYHRGFTKDHFFNPLQKKRKIGRYVLKLNEENLPENVKLTIPCLWKREGLLSPDDPLNPYRGGAAAAWMEEFVTGVPDGVLLKEDSLGNVSFAVPGEDVCEIQNFIQKYLGLNMEAAPFSYGDSFIFYCRDFPIRKCGSRGIVFDHLLPGMEVELHFYYDGYLTAANKESIVVEGKKLYIASADWNSLDVFIYKDEELFYFHKGISFMEEVCISMSVSGKEQSIPVRKLGESLTLQETFTEEQSICSSYKQASKETEGAWKKINRQLKQVLLQERKTTDILFLQPGDQDKVVKRIQSLLESEYENIWFFDAYFSDRERISFSVDWLRLITACVVNGKQCHIVFYAKDSEHAYTAVDFRKYLQNDAYVMGNLHNDYSGKIFLHQVRAPIHDRFIILSGKKGYSGIGIGTSLNSLNSNFYCVYKLENAVAKSILEILCLWMDGTNTVCMLQLKGGDCHE